MNDDTATTAARVRCAELILDRAHGKPAYLEDPNRDPDFVALAERLKWYARRDAVDAAEAKIVQILPPKKRALPRWKAARRDRQIGDKRLHPLQ